MIKNLLLFVFLIAFLVSAGQYNRAPEEKVYNVVHKVDIPITVGLAVGNMIGFKLLKLKPELSSQQISNLGSQKEDIWSFDRRALMQSCDNRHRAQTISDWGRNVSLVLPALLFIDKEIREDWQDIVILYMETQAVNLSAYMIAGPGFTQKARPFVYYPEIPIEDKTVNGATDSWFSAHTSSAAAASFFMAKVLSDYHPELESKRLWLYAAALIPPAFVGYYRYKALKHFPRDVMVGAAVGAAVGILIPQLHKFKKKKLQNLTVVPFTGKQTGLVVSLKL